jgi:hypothetical protein
LIEEWMGLDFLEMGLLLILLRIALLELVEQVLPFVGDLAAVHADFLCGGRCDDFSLVEVVAALLGFVIQPLEKGCDRLIGLWVLPEALELWVVLVATGFATQHFLGEQGFAPGGDEPCWIEVLWV